MTNLPAKTSTSSCRLTSAEKLTTLRDEFKRAPIERNFVFFKTDNGDVAHRQFLLKPFDDDHLGRVADFHDRVMAARPKPETALNAAETLVGCYQKGAYLERFPEILVAQLLALPAFVTADLLDLTNPENLINTRKFPPNIAEFVDWAKGRIAMRKIGDDYSPAYFIEQRRLLNVAVSADDFIEWRRGDLLGEVVKSAKGA